MATIVRSGCLVGSGSAGGAATLPRFGNKLFLQVVKRSGDDVQKLAFTALPFLQFWFGSATI